MTIEIDDSYIGKEFYYISQNKLRRGWITSFIVKVEFDDKGDSLMRQVLKWLFRGKGEAPKKVYTNFAAKTEESYANIFIDRITEKTAHWYGMTVYFNKEDALATVGT